MKKILIIACFLSLNTITHAQDATNYLKKRGASKLAFFAHLTNTFDPNNSSLNSDDNYYYLDLYYTDKTNDGSSIHTQVKLGKSNGILTFSSVNSTYDNDIIPPFLALLTGMTVMLEAARQNNPEEYNRQLQNLHNYLRIEPEKWNGADWALFLINLDYTCKCVDNN